MQLSEEQVQQLYPITQKIPECHRQAAGYALVGHPSSDKTGMVFCNGSFEYIDNEIMGYVGTLLKPGDFVFFSTAGKFASMLGVFPASYEHSIEKVVKSPDLTAKPKPNLTLVKS